MEDTLAYRTDKKKRTTMTQDSAIVIAPGEVVRFSDQFTPNMFFTHLKVTVVLTDRRVIVRRPNTLFGIFPKGYNEQTSPLPHISQISAGESFSTRLVLYGSFAILAGLVSFAGGAIGGGFGILLGLVLIGIGVLLLLKSHEIGVAFRNHGAGVLFAAAAKSERGQVEEAKQTINSLLFGTAALAAPTPPPIAPIAPIVIQPAPSPAGSVEQRFTAQQASDPTTSQALLSQIAEHQPSLRALVAANPNCYPGLLDWLRSLNDPEVDRALALRV